MAGSFGLSPQALPPKAENQEQESSLNIKFWGGGGYPADVRADIRADVPAQKLSPHCSERRKIVFFCADAPDPKARTSMTRGGLRKTLCRKTSG